MADRFISRIFYGSFLAAGILVAAGWLWAWVALKDIPQPLIIHFSGYTGINQIGGMGEVHGLGGTGTVIVALNLLLGQALRSRDPRRAAFLGIATVFLAALLFMALAAIISVNQ